MLGRTMTIAGTDAIAPVGFVLAGRRVPATALPAAGCHLYMDPVSAFPLALFAVTGPRWSARVPLPLAPALRGLVVPVQAGTGPTASRVGADLTRPLWLALGL